MFFHPSVLPTVFPILDANSGEDQNNRPKSVWSWWHWAVSRGHGQDRLLQSTGEITAAAITADSQLISFLCLFNLHKHTHTHITTCFVFPITRTMVHCPSAWPRLTCPCPICLTRRVFPLGSFCQSEMFVLASGLVSSTHWWERYVNVVFRAAG